MDVKEIVLAEEQNAGANPRPRWQRAPLQTEGDAMKKCILTAAVAALIGVTGCSQGTSGGPGAERAKQQERESKLKQAEDKVRQPEETFSLSVPTLSTSIKQGETKVVTIGIKRGKNFDQDVTVKFDNVPAGATIDPASATIKHDEANAKVKVKVADDAALGDFKVRVIGKPASGTEATNDLKLTFAKK
jgi:hypothetical protein